MGFGALETIDVTFDGAPLRHAVTGPGGTLFTRITVPASALPGPHTVGATGETSGRSAQAPLTVRTEWTKFHFDDTNSGFNPYENVLNASNVSGLVEKWRFPTHAPIYGSPAIAGGVVYAGSTDQYVYALNAATGKMAWRVPVSYVSSAPAVANGMVYVSTGGPVVALDARTGARVWTFHTYRGGFVSSPTVSNGVVYVGSEATATLFALNANTGKELWSFVSSNQIGSSPAVVDGVVYICVGDFNLYALDAATGDELWSFPADSYTSSPAVVDGVVYIEGFDGTVRAVEASTGAELWAFPTGATISGSAAVAGGVVYVGSDNGILYAVDAATGIERWRFDAGHSFVGSPVAAADVVYAMSLDDTLYALNAANGTNLWSVPMQSWFVGDPSPAVANGILYVGSYDKNVYAFGLP